MAEEEKAKVSSAEIEDRRSTSSPLIFISHDTRDAELAELFCKMLSSVSAGVLKAFRSSDRKGSQGIEYGVEWFPELMSKLESASDVVCLLTQRSVDRPWLLYEAGVAKGKLATSVFGVALGIPLSNASRGPFAQFQNCDDNDDSLTNLVMQLVRRIPGADPDREAILMQVKTFKERSDQILATLDNPENEEATASVDDTSVAKLFEEVKVMFQDLPSRVESRVTEGSDHFRRRRMRRFHPKLLDELMFTVSEDFREPIGILVLASFLREDFPWFYEIALEAYRELKSGDWKSAERTMTALRRASKSLMRGPIMEEMGLFSKEMDMLIHELPMMLDHYIHRYIDESEKKPIDIKEKSK